MKTKKQVIRTRFAPSPSGNLHIGNIRTALFNYIFAKQNKGKFILRIEDTNAKKSKTKYIKNIYDILSWLGIKPDESPKKNFIFGPYQQRKRKKIYQQHVKQLLLSQKAYYCFCSLKEIEEEKKKFLANNEQKNYQYSRKCLLLNETEQKEKKKANNSVVRLKIEKKNSYEFKDILRGIINTKGENIEDFVISRNDGTFLYNLAAVVDDHLMKISHVIRGEDHITNTHKQIAIYRAFNWSPPLFLHLPLIFNSQGKKFSKSDKEIKNFEINQLKKKGYLPAAILNFLLFLGWHPGNKQEIFSKKEMIKHFNLEGLQHSSAVFNLKKLNWYNYYYLQKLSNKEFLQKIMLFLQKKYSKDITKHYQKKKIFEIVQFLKPQINFFQQIVPLTKFFFKEIKNVFISKKKIKLTEIVIKEIKNIHVWNKENIKLTLIKICQQQFITKKDLFHFLRKIITGKKEGIELAAIIFFLEKNNFLQKMKKIINNTLTKTS